MIGVSTKMQAAIHRQFNYDCVTNTKSLKLKLMKYPAIHTNYIISHSTTLIIIFDTV